VLVLLASRTFADDRDNLIGTWRIAVFQDDGRDRLGRLGAGPAKKGQPPRVAKIVFTTDACYLIRGDGRREMASGLSNAGWKSCMLDESTKPKSIDIVAFAGKANEKTKTYVGIYEIEGDRLRICYAESGQKRSTKFESSGNDNLLECRRISKEPLPVPEQESE
jgi:uncharacterized protein (TIGR03067 family)